MITLLQPKPGGWLLMIGPPNKNSTVLSAIVQMTKRGPLRVLDCAGYFSTEAPVRKTSSDDGPFEDQVTIVPAATCDQVFQALKAMRPSQTEFVVLDMLRPFYPRWGDSQYCKQILRACIKQLDRLAKKASGIVTVSPPVVPSSMTLELLAILNASSNGSLSSDPLENGPHFSGHHYEDHPFSDLPLF
jgi:hypothetical protein